MNDPTKNCSEIILLLDAYHDNEVSKAEKEIVESHLANCQSCTDNLKQIASLVQSLQSLPLFETSCDLTDKLDNLLPLEKAQPANIEPLKAQAKIIAFPSYKFALAALAACAILTILTLKFMPKGNVEVATMANKQVISNTQENKSTQAPVTVKEKIPAKQELANAITNEAKVAAVSKKSKNNTEHKADQVQNKQELASNVDRQAKVSNTADKQQAPIAVTANNNPTANPSDTMTGKQETLPTDEIQTAEIATVYEGEPRGTAETIGIATDEDGLYALKL